MQQQASDVELRISELQTQIDKLTLALNRSQNDDDRTHPTEERLSQLLERCTETLSRVAAIDERHAKVIAKLEARLSDWSFVEARLEQDSDQRIRQFEQIIEHEWEALRKLHEEPAKQLREQAASLGETCVAAANLALRSFERAEARIAALESGLQGRISQLAGEFEVAIAEFRGGSPSRSPLPRDVSPFPLESVMRIHDELRRGDNAREVPHPPQLPAAAILGEKDTESVKRPLAAAQPPAPASTSSTKVAPRTWRTALVVAVLAVIGASVLVFWVQRRVQAKLNDAEMRATAAEREAVSVTELASRQIAETRENADARLAEARETALRAQIMTNILAAPDLIRFNLGGGPAAPRAYAQVLWSRSRGLVLSASRVPAPSQGTTYQLWLLTAAGPVSAGVFAPDAAGRATLATDTPPNVSRPVLSAAVTREPSGGRQQPTGDTVLTRAQ